MNAERDTEAAQTRCAALTLRRIHHARRQPHVERLLADIDQPLPIHAHIRIEHVQILRRGHAIGDLERRRQFREIGRCARPRRLPRQHRLDRARHRGEIDALDLPVIERKRRIAAQALHQRRLRTPLTDD